ncbi:class I SAM-dependent methyltransferase [Aquimarina algiphila]|uniref:class I SAM-dependent methyltransferase n=1 Tax=Aquimarina algiphila TaxID=2047982 RepID=UPI00232DBD0E|nr:methyltransferase domain-containing protein [Aquimarina algiphila]
MQNDQKVISCQLCGSSSELKHDAFTGYQEGTTFQIYYCDNCMTSFSMPRIDASKMYEVIYKNGNTVPGYDRYWEYLENIKKQTKPLQYLADAEDTFWGIQDALRQIVKNEDKETKKILEIGSGLGYLTYSLRKENYNSYGLDISQEAVDQANQNLGEFYICKDLFEYAETNTESFDIVIFTEVIEHVEEPISFIEAIVKLLKPNGSIILTTPNKSFTPLDVVWSTDLPPIHHWWFSEESIKYIAKKFNLITKFIDFSSYHKKHYKLHKIRRDRLPAPILGKNWELLRKSRPPRKNKGLYKSILFSIPFIKLLYTKFKLAVSSNVILGAERGPRLCVIMQKDAK